MDVTRWLEALGLGEYAAAFEAQAVDSSILPTLTDDDLKDLGVFPLGHRRKLAAAIAALAAAPAPDATPSAERRQLTVAFVDLVGSTSLSASMDPEDLGALIRDYQDLVAAEVARFGGQVAQYLGDGVLAYFGWPRAFEDNAERAVRAALGILGAIAKPSPDGPALQVRIGIATGQVVVGKLVEADARGRGTAIGETPNLAARLQALARPGTIVIADSTRQLLGDTFELAAQPAQRLKGLPGEVAAFEVLAERRAESRYVAQRRRASALFGRDEELATLRACWGDAERGRGRHVLVDGDPGIGKSRLVEAITEALQGMPHYRLLCQCSPFHTDSALHPVIGQLRHAARLAVDDDPAAQLAKLRALLELATADVESALYFVGGLFGLAVDYPAGAMLTPALRRQRTLTALRDQLFGLSRSKPVLWVLEDLHWADPTTLELLDMLAAGIAGERVLLLVTSRPDARVAAHDVVDGTRLSLNALSRSAATELMFAETGGRALPPAVVDEIIVRTDGVPLYIEETTRAILESGRLVEVAGQLRATGDASIAIVPSSLQDSLLARLDRLPRAKALAQAAAVIGRTFEYSTLAAAVEDLTDLGAGLAELEDSGLLFRRGAPPEATYTFKHALVRDTAYGSLLKARRVALHGRVLEAYVREASTAYAVMAQHAEAAESGEEALRYWEQATAQALAVPALQEALSRNANALRVCRRLGASPAQRRREQALCVQRAQITIPVFGYTAEETRVLFEEALAIATELDDLSLQLPAAYGLVPVRYVAGETFREPTQRFAALAARHPDDGPRLVAARLQGLVAFHDGDFAAARRLFDAAIAGFDPERHADLLQRYGQDNRTAAATYLSVAEWISGHPDTALRTARQADAWAAAANHANSRLYSHCLGHMIVMILLRRRAEVETMAREALRLSAQFGAGNYVGWSHMALMWATDDREFAAGFDDHTTFGRWRQFSWALVAETMLRASEPEAALRCVGKALEWLDAMEDVTYAAETHRMHGQVLLHAGAGRAAATAALQRALDVARAQQALSWELRAACDLARLWAEDGERQRALDLLAPVHARFTEGFGTEDVLGAARLVDALR